MTYVVRFSADDEHPERATDYGKCWADSPHGPPELRYEYKRDTATTAVGLCDYHFREIVSGEPHPKPEPYMLTPPPTATEPKSTDLIDEYGYYG